MMNGGVRRSEAASTCHCACWFAVAMDQMHALVLELDQTNRQVLHDFAVVNEKSGKPSKKGGSRRHACRLRRVDRIGLLHTTISKHVSRNHPEKNQNVNTNTNAHNQKHQEHKQRQGSNEIDNQHIRELAESVTEGWLRVGCVMPPSSSLCVARSRERLRVAEPQSSTRRSRFWVRWYRGFWLLWILVR